MLNYDLLDHTINKEVCMDDDYIFENPQKISGFEILHKEAEDFYLKFINNKNNILIEEVYDGGFLYKNKNKYFILDKNIERLTYYMSYSERKVRGKFSIYQNLVWRDTDVIGTKDVPINIFFKYLFPIHNLVVTDRQQTESGSRFWLNVLGIAKSKGFHIYYTDLNLKDDPFKEIHSSQDLIRDADTIWGSHERHQARLLVLSKDSLAEVKMSESLDAFGIPISE